MIRGVNQSMINRYISGGGSACRCIEGGSNDGKITVSFTLYSKSENGTTTSYVTEEDAARIFKAILSVDPEKYAFYLWDIAYINKDGRMHRDGFPCMTMVTYGVSSDDPYRFVNIMAVSNGNNKPVIKTAILNGELDNSDPTICSYTIGGEIPSDAAAKKHTFTFYYMER